jgi:hypothetical protein
MSYFTFSTTILACNDRNSPTPVLAVVNCQHQKRLHQSVGKHAVRRKTREQQQQCYCLAGTCGSLQRGTPSCCCCLAKIWQRVSGYALQLVNQLDESTAAWRSRVHATAQGRDDAASFKECADEMLSRASASQRLLEVSSSN